MVKHGRLAHVDSARPRMFFSMFVIVRGECD